MAVAARNSGGPFEYVADAESDLATIVNPKVNEFALAQSEKTIWAHTGTTWAQLGNRFDVRAYGVTTSSSDNKTAIDAMIAANPGVAVFYWPAGTYISAGDHELKTNHYHIGDGVGTTILQLKASSPTGRGFFKSTNFDTLTGTTPVPPADGIYSAGLRDISLNGNKANQGVATGQVGLKTFGHGLRMINVEWYNWVSHGWQSEWNGTIGPITGESVKRHLIVGCTAHDNGGDGFSFKGPTDCKWFGCVAHSNGNIGYNLQLLSDGHQLNACHSWGVGQTYGYYLGATAIQLFGCQLEAGSTAAVIILKNSSMIQGGRIYRNTSQAVKGIILGDGSNAVSGCNIMTKIENCDSGAIDFANDAGNHLIFINVYQTTGTAFAGTPHSSTEMLSRIGGGATGQHDHLEIQTSVASMVPVIVKGATAQSVSFTEWRDVGDVLLSRIGIGGHLQTKKSASPAVGNLQTSEMALYVDATTAGTSLGVGVKDAGGTLRTRAFPMVAPQTADVTTSQTTTSLTYADLATTGPTVTINIGVSGLALVIISAELGSNTAADGAYASLSVDAAGAVDADACGSAVTGSTTMTVRSERQILVSGLSAASHTFQMKYRAVTGGTATFVNRRIVVVPL